MKIVVRLGGGGGNVLCNRALRAPKEVLEAHRQFKKRLRNALRIGNKEVQIASTKDELEKQIEEIQNPESIHTVARKNFDKAVRSRNEYQLEREHGPKKVGRWAQEFASGFARFVATYSGILEIVRRAGGPYGEVGYQTLSILLIVGVFPAIAKKHSLRIATGCCQQK